MRARRLLQLVAVLAAVLGAACARDLFTSTGKIARLLEVQTHLASAISVSLWHLNQWWWILLYCALDRF